MTQIISRWDVGIILFLTSYKNEFERHMVNIYYGRYASMY